MQTSQSPHPSPQRNAVTQLRNLLPQTPLLPASYLETFPKPFSVFPESVCAILIVFKIMELSPVEPPSNLLRSLRVSQP
jgi:hypothetical protein